MRNDSLVRLDALHVNAMLLLSDHHAPPRTALPAPLRCSVSRAGALIGIA